MSDVTNEDRSHWAYKALIAYCDENRHYEVDLSNPDEFSEVVRDFFCDLRHLAEEVPDTEPADLEAWFFGSEEVYQEEVDEEAEEEAENASESAL